jgi:GT2 family glycosyltransferase
MRAHVRVSPMAESAVVIPVFNPGHFIDIAVRSVLEQTVRDIEVVLVDDGGSEDITRVCTDPRIRLIKQANAGVASARNRGIAETSARFVAFLDQDDVWLPGKLEAQLAELARTTAPLCSTDFEIIDRDGNRIGPGFREHFFTYRDFLLGDGVLPSTMLARREALVAIGGFNPSYRYASDWDLLTRLTQHSGTLARVPTVLAQYRMHETNESHFYRAILEEGKHILSGHLAGPESDAATEGLRRLYKRNGAQAFDAFRRSRQWRDLEMALRLNPGNIGHQFLRFVERHVRRR